MPLVRVVLLDAGGTLFRERPSRAAIYAEVAGRHGLAVTPTAVEAAMRASHAALAQRVDGGFRYSRPWFARFIGEVFARVGHDSLPAGLAPALFDRFREAATFALYDDVVPALDALARRGVQLGVVSNWSESLPDLLAGLGLRDRFGFVLASALEQVEKPDPELFMRALRRAGVGPGEALHVGDRVDNDVEGARSAGIRALLLDREGRRGDFAGERIDSLADVPARLPSG